ncbi:hypothetical protein Psch_01034 [Pelotomaculum schinkii]|uniref:Uncharacterized protein n=1 Tax=Pelotomaculum schinkii TaxID=78350 RepID=A0A4Y7RFF1_9FIRM|nr:hypothetical protein [Pelotomaculum schinkii]TEB07480.1 hypothetical protein Psch_01034 [Pelotomaculum schinkii]
MLKLKLLRVAVIVVLTMTTFVPVASARLAVSSPEYIISKSPITLAIFWPGIIAFLLLLGLSLAGLCYYTRSKQNRSPLFWILGILICITVSYITATFAITPLLLS